MNAAGELPTASTPMEAKLLRTDSSFSASTAALDKRATISGGVPAGAPAGTPPEIVALLSKAAVEALKDESVRKSFASMGVEAVGSSPAAFMQVIRDDLQRWSALIRDKGIKVD